MYLEAKYRMQSRLKRSDAYRQAEANGREQMTALMRAFGFRTVICSFEKKKSLN